MRVLQVQPCNALAYRAGGIGSAIGSNAERIARKSEESHKVQVSSKVMCVCWSNGDVEEQKRALEEVNSLPAQKVCGPVANYHLRFTVSWPATERPNVQQCFPFMTPMLATICGRELLVATKTRTIYLASGCDGAQ